MKYTREDIKTIIKAIKDYKFITGIVDTYKNNEIIYETFFNDLEKLSGVSIIRHDELENYLDFSFNDIILTINIDPNGNYKLSKGIEVINNTGETIASSMSMEELENYFQSYVWEKISNYIDKSSYEELKRHYDWYKVENNDKEDLKNVMYESYFNSFNDENLLKQIDILDANLKKQESNKEQVYTKYDVDCMIYLALQIESIIYKNKNGFMIDTYTEEIKSIYEDYKKHDNNNKSLLDSINDYVYSHVTTIKEKLDKAFSDYWDL